MTSTRTARTALSGLTHRHLLAAGLIAGAAVVGTAGAAHATTTSAATTGTTGSSGAVTAPTTPTPTTPAPPAPTTPAGSGAGGAVSPSALPSAWLTAEQTAASGARRTRYVDVRL